MSLRSHPLRVALVALALAPALLAGCSRELAWADRTRGKDAVRRYLDASRAAYLANDPALLAPVATERELRKVIALIDLKRANGLVLDGTVESLEVQRVTRTEDGKLQVATRERWRYFDRPAAGGGPSGQVFVAVMELDYDLVLEGGAWKVAEVRGRSTEYLEPKGYQPHRGTSHGSGEAKKPAQGGAGAAPAGN